jgi:predicted nucleic acid-binding protein
LAWDLGAGETAVISYVAANPGWTAILDDGAARRCARAFDIPVKGTLAVVLLAKQRKLIPSARTLLGQLRNNGFRIEENLLIVALRTIGED